MSTLRMLDVAIGMTFIFLLVSLICSAINEMIEAVLKNRAKDLEEGIRQLIDGSGQVSDSYVAKLYEHPLINGLFRNAYKTRGHNLPAYIPARIFALAVLDIFLPASRSGVHATGATANSAAGMSPQEADVGSPALDAETGTQAAPAPGAPASGAAAMPAQPNALAALRTTAEALPKDLNVRGALLALIDSTAGDVHALRQSVEDWYNDSMDRVAGWYKRRVQFILVGIGVAAAVAINADAIALFKSLSNDGALRESLVAAAQEYARPENRPGGAADTLASQARFNKALGQLEELRLPIGWDWKRLPAAQSSQASLSNAALALPSTWPGWLLKAFGWFITGVAVSLGAPFWFDLLNKFMVIRSTVKPTEKSPPEGSEDRSSGK